MNSFSLSSFLANLLNGSTSCDWSQLPDSLLAVISNKFACMDDFVRFGAVCVSWRSVTLENRIQLFPPQVPFLMFPKMHDNTRRYFHYLCNGEVYNPVMDVPSEKYCGSSTHGWLVTVGVDPDFKVELMNPFFSVENKIELPPLTSFDQHETVEELSPDGYMKKTVLSACPTRTSDYVVMTIYGAQNKLAFTKPGDKQWTTVEHEHKCFNDLIYYKGEFYAVDGEGTVIACNIKNHSQPKVRKVASPPPDGPYRKNYIVESLGELFQIRRVLEFDFDGCCSTYNTIAFKVFKLDQYDPIKWVEIKTMGGQTLFLGDNASISLSSSDFPQCKPNSIYFTDDARNLYGLMGPHDIGVFSLEDGCGQIVEPNPLIDFKGLMPPPIWVEPTLEHGRK
ncbi:hypothetical protein GIB67_033204 [Kingdonia uniflora]|uniref:KIB1-4 beta-propeller domain-containing protein n=1 Tax=Kingdonia uniflora TaxID=39325 RepID=A0A7J7MP65_9MAGN|nr:hypothetical protein GIB67_033204 [Kingdonia uniflora]